MQLTPTERLILRNQLEILKLLNAPTHSSKTYDEQIEILEAGYEVFYESVFGVIDEGTPATVTEEVFEILNLYRALDAATRKGLTIPAGSAQAYPDFVGFDGNNEDEHLRFTTFLMDVQGKYQELAPSKNSHHPTLATYRGMVQRWKALGAKHALQQSDVNAILI